MKFRKVLVLKARLDMAPLIDVVFLLLIFFLLTSSFVLQPGIKVKLPKAKTTEISKEEEVYITIDKDNFLYLNEKLIPEEELNKRLLRLASEDPNKLVIVKADQVDELSTFKVARQIKEQIEEKMTYPGTIKVTVIRETRATDIAK
ncbi:biopolymer transporter ExbD [bacterium]|nr:biopolymer transporter ExbD [bacterium]